MANNILVKNGAGADVTLVTTDIGSDVHIPHQNIARVGNAAVALGQTTMSASIPVTLASNQTAVPTIENAVVYTGAAAQTTVVNNILEPVSGSAGTAVENLRSGSVQVVSTGTAGTFIFEQSLDNVNWVALPVFNAALVTGVPITAAITASASQIIYTFPIRGRFVRLRIATTITGGSIQAFSRLSSDPWIPTANLVASNTAANLLATVSATNLSTNVAQVGGTNTVTGGVAGTLGVGGTVAEDTASTGNPVIVGGVVRTALPAATVVAGDAVRSTFSTSGQLVQKPFAPGDLDFQANLTVTTNTQTAIRAAQAAGIRQYVTQITYQNTNATATTLTIQDASTTLITFSCPASMANPVQLTFPTPLRGTAATALNYTAGTTGANVLLNVTGYNGY